MNSVQMARFRLFSIQRISQYRPEIDHSFFQTGMERQVASEPNEAPRMGLFTGEVPSFLSLATWCSGCEATNFRDKVYALYSICELSAYQRPKIDCTVPWQIVFIRTAKWMYSSDFSRRTSSFASTLVTAGRYRQESLDIPSWVPDFRSFYISTFNIFRAYRAGGWDSKVPSFRFLILPRSAPESSPLPAYSYIDEEERRQRIPNEGLELSMILQDMVVFASPHFHSDTTHLRRDAPLILRKIAVDLQDIENNLPKYFTGEEGRKAYAATMIANSTHQLTLASPDYKYDRFTELHAWLQDGLPDPTPAYQAAVTRSDVFAKKRFCTTSHGLMCLAPAMVTTGDYVAIIQSCDIPVALRKTDPRQQYYELLGPVYVHRMMRGRASTLMDEFKCKYQPGSEDEVMNTTTSQESWDASMNGPYEVFPYNAKSDYRHIIRAIGKRRVVLV